MSRDFDVVSLPATDHPEVGDTAPDFSRPLVNREFWKDVTLATLADDQPVLLVFHPMDWSPTAINLWSELQDRGWAEAFDVSVVGVSISTPYDHKRFLNEQDLNCELFSDPTNEVAEAYDITHDLSGMDGISEPRPAVFLLDTNRTVKYVWVTEKWPNYPEYDAIEEVLATL